MDHISNESSVNDPFSIGPSTLIRRSVALRILFCKTTSSHLSWHHIFRAFLVYLHRLTTTLRDFLFPHPRNPRATLALVAAALALAALLKRRAAAHATAEPARRRKFWRNAMESALTYEEWSRAAKMLDGENPNNKTTDSDLYDADLVASKLRDLRRRRREEATSLRDVVFGMRADLVRNLGNMCNPELHKGRLRLPTLIQHYIDEVAAHLRLVSDSDPEELLLEEKLAFAHETRHAFGRTALLLSGGASLGGFHVGVVQTLVEHGLLPRIVSGSSIGSVTCSVVATRSWPEIRSFFEDSWHSFQLLEKIGGISNALRRVVTRGAIHEVRQMQMMVRHLTNNMTFQEAYDVTGRVLGITVSSLRRHEPPRCLNYLTSPNVFIWSAVTASCAFPGFFEAQELMAKDRSGKIVPYHPPFHLGLDEDSGSGSGSGSRRWRDGSLEMDLPIMQLKELFNVNHFVVSQANPHIAPLLRAKEAVRAYGGNFAAKLAKLAEMEVKHRCNQILELGFPMRGLAKLFAQEWEGDVTMVMPATLEQMSKILQNPSSVDLQKGANQGRRCTWEKLSAIKANCSIELALDECVASLNRRRRLKRSQDREAASSSQGPLNAAVRVHESNSPEGALEDDIIVADSHDAILSPRNGINSFPRVSESVVGLNSIDGDREKMDARFCLPEETKREDSGGSLHVDFVCDKHVMVGRGFETV